MLSDRIVDRLLLGDIEFLERFSNEQLDFIANEIRNSPYRKSILFSVFKDLSLKYPKQAFKITYDLPEYNDFWLRSLKHDTSVFSDYQFLLFFMLTGDWEAKFVSDNLESIVLNNKDSLFAIIRYSERVGNYELIDRLKNHYDMKIRGMFIVELLQAFPQLFYKVFDTDLLECFVKYNDKGEEIGIVEEQYVSKIASLILLHHKDELLYVKIRDFILKRYSFNVLAAELDRYGKLVEDINPLNSQYLISDINELFRTSKNYKYVLFTKYGKYLDRELYYEFLEKLEPFINIDDEIIADIFLNGLGDKFLEYVDKYLSMSTGAKVISDVGRGSCTRTFRIGDYVIKCSNKKWSLEDSICPNNYLVLKNLEEEIVRKETGEVTGAIEVQRYLSRPLLVSEWKSIYDFQEAFKATGYYIKDRLVDEEYGPNCRHLEDYRLADCDSPEDLPEWFKKDPVVLVDRDLVFSLSNKKPKIKAVNL